MKPLRVLTEHKALLQHTVVTLSNYLREALMCAAAVIITMCGQTQPTAAMSFVFIVQLEFAQAAVPMQIPSA